MKNAAKYAVLAIGPIALVVSLVLFWPRGPEGIANTVLFYNVVTGESERMSLDDAGVSVRRDDQNRKCIFIVVGEDGDSGVSSGDTLYIRDRERSVFDQLVRDGKLTLDNVKVDPKTYQILQ